MEEGAPPELYRKKKKKKKVALAEKGVKLRFSGVKKTANMF